MAPYQLYLVVGLLVVVLIYLFWRLDKLERLLKHYKLKNQEGVGAWTKTRNPLFLILALFEAVYCLVSIVHQGFQIMDLYRIIFLVGLPLYLYFREE